MRIPSLLGGLLAALCAGSVLAEIIPQAGHVRATAPGQSVSSAYLALENRSGESRRLVAAACDCAGRAELHEHQHSDGMMRMRQVRALEIAPGRTLRFTPGGYHIMLFELSDALQPGQQVSLTLFFANGEQQRVNLPVKTIQQEQHHQH